MEILFEKVYSEGTPTLLGDFLSSIESGSRPKGGAGEGTIPSIGAEKIEKFGTYDYSGEKYISEDYFNKLKRGVVQAGDVLLYKDGAYTGKVSMALGGFPHRKCAVNEHVFLLRTPGKSYQSYLYFSLSQKEVREKVFAIASGKAAQPGLNQKELSDIEINLPDAATLTKFEGTAKPFLDEIAKRAIENRCLASLRDTLLPKLLSGEVSI